MKNKFQTKKQLIDELNRMRQRVVELEQMGIKYRKIESVLREYETYFHRLPENVSDVIWVIDNELRFIYVSPYIEHIVGLRLEEIIKAGPDAILTDSSYCVIRSILEEATIEGMSRKRSSFYPRTLNIEYRHKDSSTIWAEIKLVFLQDSDTRITGLLGINSCISKSDEKSEGLLCNSDIIHNRLIVKSATDLIWTMDLNLQFTYLSPSIVFIRGYSPEEAINHKLQDVLSPASFKTAIDIFTEELSREKRGVSDPFRLRTIELEFTRQDGSTVWREVKATFLRDANRCPIGIIGVSRDISERRRAEEALWESEERYKTLVDYSIDGITIIQGLRIIFVNQAMLRMFGCRNEEEMIGREFTEFISPDYRNLMVERLALEKTATTRYEFKALHKNGSQFDAEIAIGVIKYNGKMMRQGIVRDITERKKVEQILRESEERYRAIFEQAVDSIVLIDSKTGAMVDFNDRAHQTLGYTREEFRKLKISDFEIVESPEEVARHTEKIVRNGSDTFETRHRTKDGRIRDMLINAKAISIGGKEFIQSIWHDVTTRKRAEEVLRKAYQTTRNLLEKAPLGIYVVNTRGDIDYVNPAMVRITGNTYEQFKNLNVFKLRPYRELGIADKIRLVLQGETFFMGPIEYTSQYSRRTTVMNFMGIPAEEYGERKAFIFVEDLTERRKAEEELRDSEQRLKILFEYAPDAHFLCDVRGSLLTMNRAAENLTGYKARELFGRNLLRLKLLPEEEIFKARELLEKVISGEHIGPVEFILNKKRGRDKVIAEIRAFPIKIKGETFIFSSARDITERKRTEERIRESEEKYRASFNEARDAIFIFSRDRKILDVNKQLIQLSRYSKCELLSIRLNELYPETYVIEEKLKKLLNGEEIPVFETILLTKRKIGIPVEIAVTILKNCFGEEIVFQGNIRDITERRKAQQALQDAYNKLKHTQEQLIQSSKMAAMGQLAAGISHELNQPLTGIKGFAQAAFADLQEGNPIRKDLERIIEQSERMSNIIKSIKTFARKSDFVMRRVDVNEPLENSLRLLDGQLRLHNIRVSKHLARDLPMIMADSNQLQQVFLNLITNARDAICSLRSLNGGQISVKSFLSKDRTNIHIILQDTGCGIPERNLSSIFNPFFTTKLTDKGMGLGLSIVYRIIETHKGIIQVESIEGKGTTFKITLPVE